MWVAAGLAEGRAVEGEVVEGVAAVVASAACQMASPVV